MGIIDDNLTQGGPATRPCILAVDDEASLLAALQEYFALAGLSVDTAVNPAQAERLLAERAYDAVLLDLALSESGGWDGLRLIGSIRAHSPSARVIVFTGNAVEAVARRVAGHAVDAVVFKPVDFGELVALVARVVRGNTSADFGPGRTEGGTGPNR